MDSWLSVFYRQFFHLGLIFHLVVSCPPSKKEPMAKPYPDATDVVNAWGSIQSFRIRPFYRREHVLLDCAVEFSYDATRVIWMRNHVHLNLDAHSAAVFPNGTLVLSDVNYGEQGIYQCIAPTDTNRYHQETHKPPFTTNLYPGMQYILKDATVAGTKNTSDDWQMAQTLYDIPYNPRQAFPLYCRNYQEFPRNSHHPHRTVYWTYNDVELSLEDSDRFVHIGETDMLVVLDARKTDNKAVLQCIAVYHHSPSDPDTPHREKFALVKAGYRYRLQYVKSLRLVQNWDYYRNQPNE
ncbi:uncharacterized protein LOC129594293 [Paramacrobiotus metropolitanus]|uniref:uncharacterized protein LOC129594293 n=1 Tax=Paramacrobiotus metropolitanus TaxID=2943436 RepID=UPI0024459268|nr:uncharacterized protein LOC129594293 [Paramacrobiotus metropolitanus]